MHLITNENDWYTVLIVNEILKKYVATNNEQVTNISIFFFFYIIMTRFVSQKENDEIYYYKLPPFTFSRSLTVFFMICHNYYVVMIASLVIKIHNHYTHTHI